MKASLKSRYDADKSAASVDATFVVNVGDVKLGASMKDATFSNGPSLNGLEISLDMPRRFVVTYNVPKKDFRFQFMETVRVGGKPLNLSYIHHKADNRTILNGTLVVDSANKVSANGVLGSNNCKLTYSYLHQGVTTFEPVYDLAKNSWDFALSRRVYADDVFKASYQTSTKALGLEWSRNSKLNGNFKITASVNLGEELKMPKLIGETTWDLDF